MERNSTQLRVNSNCNQINSNFNAIKSNFNNNNNRSNGFKERSEGTVRQNPTKPQTNSQSSHRSSRSSEQSSHQRHVPNGDQLSSTRSNNINNNPSADAVMDRTPCGSEQLTPHFDEAYDTPPHERWAQDFDYLIYDDEGVQLFREYLLREGLVDLLDFWFAVHGFRTYEYKDRVFVSLRKAIFRNYIFKSKVIVLSDEVRQRLKDEFNAGTTDPNNELMFDSCMFDCAQREVEEQLKASIYINFFSSDVFLNYFHSSQSTEAAAEGYDHSVVNNERPSNQLESSLNDYNNQYYEVLATVEEVDEDSGLTTAEPSVRPKTKPNPNPRSQTTYRMAGLSAGLSSPLSSDALRNRLQDVKSERLTTESHPLSPNNSRYQAMQSYMRSKQMVNPPNPYHVKYSTILPTSAQDSEISSHSTNDSISCVTSRKRELISNKQNAKINANANTMNVPHIPRTLQPQPPSLNVAANPVKFAQKLTERLEKVRIAIEMDERETNKMTELLFLIPDVAKKTNKQSVPNPIPTARHLAINPSTNTTNRPNSQLKEVLTKQKLEFRSEDNDQILDNHIAQVFADTPNITPTDSIGRSISPPKHTYYSNNYLKHNYDHKSGTSSVGSSAAACDQVVVTVKYSTEQMPYRLMMSGPNITLRKFKQQIPAKKGQQWQYYFKKKCTDIESGVPYVMEKITEDNVLLPLIDGKIFAELQESI